MATKTATKTAKKPAAKVNGKTPAPTAKAKRQATEKKENRYLRAARVLIETGEGVAIAELAVRAGLSEPAAAYCLDSFKGVTQALREAKLLPQKATPAKAPTAPKARAKEPVPA